MLMSDAFWRRDSGECRGGYGDFTLTNILAARVFLRVLFVTDRHVIVGLLEEYGIA